MLFDTAPPKTFDCDCFWSWTFLRQPVLSSLFATSPAELTASPLFCSTTLKQYVSLAQLSRAASQSVWLLHSLLVWIFVKCSRWRRLYKLLDRILRVSRHPSHSLILCFTRAHLEIKWWMNIAMMWISMCVGMNTSISPAGVARQQPVTNIYESLEYNKDVRFYHFAFPVNKTFGMCVRRAEKTFRNAVKTHFHLGCMPRYNCTNNATIFLL